MGGRTKEGYNEKGETTHNDDSDNAYYYTWEEDKT